MAKIPFDIKYRPQIESGKYKVETFSGYPVTIYRWYFDDGGQTPIMGSYVFEDGKEYVGAWGEDGHFDLMSPNDLDLFIVTPEEELTEFEKACMKLYNEGRDDGLSGDKLSNESVKESATELLALVREQFIKDGYVIEKKAFHDAVEKIDDKHKADMSVEYSLHCKVENGTRRTVMNWNEFQKVAQHFIDCGKAEALRTRATELTENLVKSGLYKDGIPYHLIEFMCNLYDCQNWKEIEKTAEAYATRLKAAALKDLPRWRKLNNIHEGLPYRSLVLYGMDDKKWEIADKGKQIGVLAMYIPIGDLKELPKDYNGELPGFKKDSHE